jgi:cysteinyl-tRNA synthetase
MLKLFNSYSSKKENVEPFEKDLVKIFICGPTLYDYTHLGHSRIFLTYDLLCRYLQYLGYNTDVLVNMTDINQNVFNKAREESSDYHAIAKFYASKFMEDIAILNIHSINRFAFVSDYLSSIEKQISKMLERGVAYSANGNIYLDTSRLETYGTLSKQSPEQLLLHRLDIGPNKKSQADIMLWNSADDFYLSWNSKFGKGVPWWHMQDTAVAIENFGHSYDIHGGARELSYPHHEAHLAQYTLLSGIGKPIKIWMHVGLVLSNGEKMSKSLGNVVWSRDLVQKYGQNLLRLYLFSTHYVDDIDFKESNLEAKKPLLEKIQIASLKTSEKTDDYLTRLIDDFFTSLGDDLNSVDAIETFEKICTSTINGNTLNRIDFECMCQTLGIKL